MNFKTSRQKINLIKEAKTRPTTGIQTTNGYNKT